MIDETQKKHTHRQTEIHPQRHTERHTHTHTEIHTQRGTERDTHMYRDTNKELLERFALLFATHVNL